MNNTKEILAVLVEKVESGQPVDPYAIVRVLCVAVAEIEALTAKGTDQAPASQDQSPSA